MQRLPAITSPNRSRSAVVGPTHSMPANKGGTRSAGPLATGHASKAVDGEASSGSALTSRLASAAYLIQHTYRLYKLKKEEHWDLKISKKGHLGQLLKIKHVPAAGGEAGQSGSQQNLHSKRQKSFSFGVAEKYMASRRGNKNSSDDDGNESGRLHDPTGFGDEFGLGASSAVFDSSMRATKDIAPMNSKSFSPSVGGDLLSRPQTAASTTSNAIHNPASMSLTSPITGRLVTPDEQKGFMIGFQQGLLLAQQQLMAAQQQQQPNARSVVSRDGQSVPKRNSRRQTNMATETQRTSRVNVPRNAGIDHDDSSGDDEMNHSGTDGGGALSRSQSRGTRIRSNAESTKAPLGSEPSYAGATPPKNLLQMNRPPSLSPRFIENALSMMMKGGGYALDSTTSQSQFHHPNALVNNSSAVDVFNGSVSAYTTPFGAAQTPFGNGGGAGTPPASFGAMANAGFANSSFGAIGGLFGLPPPSPASTSSHQCLACGRSPQTRVVTSGRRPFPSTPFAFATSSGSQGGGKADPKVGYTRLSEEEQRRLHQDSIMRQRPSPPTSGSPSSARRGSIGRPPTATSGAYPTTRFRGSASNEALMLPAISR